MESWGYTSYFEHDTFKFDQALAMATVQARQAALQKALQVPSGCIPAGVHRAVACRDHAGTVCSDWLRVYWYVYACFLLRLCRDGGS